MRSFINIITNPLNILSYSLGFVALWFGLNEMFFPKEWLTFTPSFIGSDALAVNLVIIHGAILTICALLLFSNIYRKLAAIILALLFIEIIIDLVSQTGVSDIVVRDIGLCGMAIGLALLTPSAIRT